MLREVVLPSVIRLVNGSVEEVVRELIRACQASRLSVSHALVITTRNLYERYLRDSDFDGAGFVFIEDATMKTALRVYETYLSDDSSPVIVGFGGGKVIDVSKYVAFLRALPVISAPTTLSNDGICSPVSVLIDSRGRRHSLRAAMPIAVVASLKIIKKSPVKYIVAGIGDMLAKISSLQDWLLSHEVTGERIDDTAFLLTKTATMNIYRRLRHEVESVEDVMRDDFLSELFFSLVISGISMYIAGSSRPASGAEHLISHAIDYLYPHKSGLHGFQVAYGTLVAEVLRGNDIDELVDIYTRIGLPTSHRDLGLTEEEIVNAILYAPRMRRRYTILHRITLTKSLARDAVRKVEKASRRVG